MLRKYLEALWIRLALRKLQGMKRHSHLSSQRQAELREHILARHSHSLDRETNVLYSRANTGFFSNCSHSLWCLIDLANIGLHPRTLNFSGAYQHFKDVDLSTDIYPDLFATDDFVAEYVKSTLVPYHRLRCPDHHGIYAIYPYQELNPLIHAYFRPSAKIKSLIKNTTEQYRIDYANTIAICYRGSDKATEVRLADPTKYVHETLRLKNEGTRVLVQTDQEQVKRQLLESIDASFAFEDMPTTSGNTVLHKLAKDSLGMEKYAFSERLLATAYIISKCRYVVNHSGNMAAWICLLRGSANGVSQFDKHGNLVGPYQIVKGYMKNAYRQLRRHIRGDVSCYT